MFASKDEPVYSDTAHVLLCDCQRQLLDRMGELVTAHMKEQRRLLVTDSDVLECFADTCRSEAARLEPIPAE